MKGSGLKQVAVQRFSAQQIEFMRLLHLPVGDLERRVAEELAENPLLDEAEEVGSGDKGEASEGEGWSDLSLVRRSFSRFGGEGSFDGFFERQAGAAVSTKEGLLAQLQFLSLDGLQVLIAEHIVGSLSDRGYLARSLPLIAEELSIVYGKGVSVEEVRVVLAKIQGVGPPGIAARNLQESLVLQLMRKRKTKVVGLALCVVRDYFDDLVRKNYERILEGLSLSLGVFQSVLNTIRQLRPYPIVSEGEVAVEDRLIPDFMAHVVDGRVVLSLVERSMPRLVVCGRYWDLLKKYKGAKMKGERELALFIQNRIHRAKWFIQAIEQRKKTLLLIMNAIVDCQSGFFMTGDDGLLRPLFLRDIATMIGMDVSTVSRAVSNKAIQVHGRVFALRYFFSEGIKMRGGEEVSSRVVKGVIREILLGEDKRVPLTDEELTKKLRGLGYMLARRTVTKYRLQLGIPVARLRREWL